MSSKLYVSADDRAKETGGKLLYGLDRELAEKAAAKYDHKMEQEAREWIEAVTGEAMGESSLQQELKSGIVLCTLVNALKPGCCKPPSKMKAPFKVMENIGNYLAACASLGQRQAESFQTVDLYEDQNMMAVLIQIHSLGRIAQKLPGFSGPALGVKLATANKREFTEDQLREAKNATTFLGKGSHGTPAEATMSMVDHGRNIDKMGKITGDVAGLGVGGEVGILSMGGAGTAGAAMSHVDHGRNIDKNAHVAGISGMGVGGESRKLTH